MAGKRLREQLERLAPVGGVQAPGRVADEGECRFERLGSSSDPAPALRKRGELDPEEDEGARARGGRPRPSGPARVPSEKRGSSAAAATRNAETAEWQCELPTCASREATDAAGIAAVTVSWRSPARAVTTTTGSRTMRRAPTGKQPSLTH